MQVTCYRHAQLLKSLHCKNIVNYQLFDEYNIACLIHNYIKKKISKFYTITNFNQKTGSRMNSLLNI